ncbi:MAG: PadR family transcriptional regulator [Clostridia bacterium]|nr:PadR family transcriptional regulator [Clostridia bacterium]
MTGDILRGHTETVILRILTERDSYGYEISKAINDAGDDMLDIKDATIYTAFRRMEEDALIRAYWGEGGLGGRRRYYAITDAGKKVYEEKKAEWQKINKILNNLILGGQND